MSLTSNEEIENTLSQKSLFWNRKGAGKSQEKAECPLLFKSQNILPFRKCWYTCKRDNHSHELHDFPKICLPSLKTAMLSYFSTKK